MIRPGDYVKTSTRIPMGYGDAPRGTTGTVMSMDGDWARIRLPEGGRLEAHVTHLIRVDRAQNI